MEKGEKQGRRTYTKEFKLEAVRLVRSGIPKARVSRDLGIHLNVLKAWLRQFDQDPDNPFPGKGEMRAEEAELFRLKRELMKVTAERDILKKRVTLSIRANLPHALNGRFAATISVQSLTVVGRLMTARTRTTALDHP